MKRTAQSNTSPLHNAAPAQGATDDIDALFAALADEERDIVDRYTTHQRSIEERRQQARTALFDRLMPEILKNVDLLLAHGFPTTAVAKPLTQILRAQPIGLSSSRRRPTPTTHQAWYNIILSRDIQAYLRKNRELAARLEAEGVTAADIPRHIPPADLAALQSAARVTAEKKIAASLPVQA